MATCGFSTFDSDSFIRRKCIRGHRKSRKFITLSSCLLHVLSAALILQVTLYHHVTCDAFNGFVSGPILNTSLAFTSLSLSDDSFEEPIVPDESLPQPAALHFAPDHEDKSISPEISLPTVTVRGFLNFRTTVDGTVVVFTSSSSSPASTSATVLATSRPPTIVPSSTYNFHSSKYNGRSDDNYRSSPVYSPVIDLPFVSVRDETFTSTIEPTRASATYSAVYPTGLVTALTHTELSNNGQTMVQEDKVTVTHVDGKYSQVLRDTPFIDNKLTSTTPTPPFTDEIFAVYPSEEASTASNDHSRDIPVSNGESKIKIKIESTSKEEGDLVTRFTRGDRSPPLFALSRPSLKLSSTNSPKSTDKIDTANGTPVTVETPRVRIRKIGRLAQNSSRFSWTPRSTERVRLNRFKVKVSTDHTPSSAQSRFTARDENEKEAAKLLNARLNRRLGTPRSLTTDKLNSNTQTTSISSQPFTEAPEALVLDKESSAEISDESSHTKHAMYGNARLLEGLVMDSTPAQFASSNKNNQRGDNIKPSRVIVETITYTSEVTRGFEGGEPLIDTITLTNLVDKTIEVADSPTVTEFSVQPTLVEGNIFMGPMATPPIVLSHIYEVTSSTSRTSLLPVSDSMVTVTDNFVIKQLITAYKTLPNSLGESSDLVSSLISDMNNSAYLDAVLKVNNQIEVTNSLASLDTGHLQTQSSSPASINTFAGMPSDTVGQLFPSVNNSPTGPQIDLNNPLILGAALRNPNLAAMYFGLQQLSQQVTQYTTVFKSTEVPSTETIYATKTISFYDGRQTRTRTITEPASTTIKLVSTVTPQVQPVINPQVLVQQAQLQRAFASQLLNSQFNSNPLNGNNNNNNNNGNIFTNNNGNQALAGLLSNINNQQQQQQQQQQQNQFNINNLPLPSVPQIAPSTVTETTTTLVTTTSTSSKIYTLIYNAFSTKYRTVTSTTVFPTQVVTTITKTITPTANYNSFFG